MIDHRAERQAQRDRDAEAIRTGQKTAAQVKREREKRRALQKGTIVQPPKGEAK
jgi:hypothetical protein